MNTMIQTRIDTRQKAAAEKLFQSMGTSLNDAIRMFIAQSLRNRGMPFTPTAADDYLNAETQAVIDEANEGKNVIHVKTKEELFKELDL